MTVLEFFQMRAGSWMTQRTAHTPQAQQAHSERGETVVTFLPPDDGAIAPVLKAAQWFDKVAVCGLRVEQAGQTVHLVVTTDGEFVRQASDRPPVTGRYRFSEADGLYLSSEQDGHRCEERIWLARPNICIKTGLMDGVSTATAFCTEVRRVGEPKSL